MDLEELDRLRIELTKGVVKIVFEKKDGSLRTMNATLKPGLVVEYDKKTDKQKAKNDQVMSVFDVDKKEWRSFIVEKLREVSINN